MRDGLLRRVECAEATWADLETQPDGTGALDIRRRKQRKRRSKAPVYVSLHTMVYLLRMLHLRGGPDPELSDRIFGIGGAQISNRINKPRRWLGSRAGIQATRRGWVCCTTWRLTMRRCPA